MYRVLLLSACWVLVAGGVAAEEGEQDPYLTLLAQAGRALGEERYRQADDLYEQAAQVARAADRPEQEAEALLGRCRALDAIYDLFGFRQVTERLLSVQQRLGQVEAAWRTEADLGAVLGLLGNPVASSYHLGRAISAFEEAGDEDSLGQALEMSCALSALAGDLVGALRDGERAVGVARRAVQRAVQGEDALAKARSAVVLRAALAARAGVLLQVRDGAAAARDLGEALELAEAHEPEWSVAAGLKADLATALALDATGDALDAPRQLLLEVLDLYERNGAAAGAVPALLTLARIEGQRGRHGEAQRHCLRAQGLSPEGSPLALVAGLGVANALFQQGKHDESRALYEQRLLDARKLGQLRLLERALTGAAEVAAALREDDRALQMAREAAQLQARIDESLDEENVVRADVYRSELTAVGVEVGLRKQRADYVVEFIEQGRVAGLLATLGAREAMRRVDLDPALYEEYWRAAERYSAAQLAVQAHGERGVRDLVLEAKATAEAARAEVQAVVARMERELREGSRVRHSVAATLEQIQASLAAGEALVLYELLPAQAVAVVIESERARLVDLGPRAPLEELAGAFAQGRDRKLGATTARLEEIRRRLIEPLGLPPKLQVLLLAPDAQLGRLPFHAALALSGQAAPSRLALVPSGSVHRILGQERALRGKRVLALGDPLYTEQQADLQQALTRGSMFLTPLRNSRSEVESITTPEDVRLLDREATEERLRGALLAGERWRVVHFSCHGLVDAEDPRFSALALTPGPGSDGFLSPIELMKLRIPADLITLSACSSGVGRTLEGEGVLGFTRAFMVAGASRVLVSLWDVDDKATAELMKVFYRQWSLPAAQGGGDAAAALRVAMDHVRAQEPWADPEFWAAWVLWGLP